MTLLAYRRTAAAVSAFGLVALLVPSCGSVPVPTERYYRFPPPPTAPPATPAGETARVERPSLRVATVDVAPELTGERLVVARDEVELYPLVGHAWAAPLDELVAASLHTSLTRTGAFGRVLGPLDGGGAADVELFVRVLDCHGAWARTAAESGAELRGVVTLDVRLVDGATGVDLVARELRAETPVQASQANDPAALVVALGRSLADCVDAIVADRLPVEPECCEPVPAAPR